jgi:hypothetical protein
MVVVLLAPVLVVNPQCTRLTAACASFQTQPKSPQAMLPSLGYDLAAVLLPPESSPSSLSTTPRTPVASR